MKSEKQLIKEGYKPFMGGWIKLPKDWLKNVKVSGNDGSSVPPLNHPVETIVEGKE